MLLNSHFTQGRLYKQQLNSLTLTQFEETDHIVYPTLVRATRNMWGFPKALFHLPPSLCGYGVLSTVDRTMLSKWASLHSALYSNDDQSLAAEGLLHRIAADQGYHLLPGQGVILGPPHRKSNRWWLTNLLEWGATFQSHLCRQGTRPTEDSILRPIITDLTSNLIELCNSMQLHRLADLIDYASGTPNGPLPAQTYFPFYPTTSSRSLSISTGNFQCPPPPTSSEFFTGQQTQYMYDDGPHYQTEQ